MKFIVKNLQNKSHEMECEPSLTVKEVKELLQQNHELIPEGKIAKHLIFAGKKLTDTQTLEEMGLEEGGFLVVMPGKATAPPPVAPSPEVEESKSAPPPAVPAPAESKSEEVPAAMPAPEAGGNPLAGLDLLGGLGGAGGLEGMPPQLLGMLAMLAQQNGGQLPQLDPMALNQMMLQNQFCNNEALRREILPQQSPFAAFLLKHRPEMFTQIINDADLMKKIFTDGFLKTSGAPGGMGAPEPEIPDLTEEDDANIAQLMELTSAGKARATEAYVSCDKNMEHAINLLFSESAM